MIYQWVREIRVAYKRYINFRRASWSLMQTRHTIFRKIVAVLCSHNDILTQETPYISFTFELHVVMTCTCVILSHFFGPFLFTPDAGVAAVVAPQNPDCTGGEFGAGSASTDLVENLSNPLGCEYGSAAAFPSAGEGSGGVTVSGDL